MADIVDRLNRLSDTLIGLNLDMKLPPNSIDPREAADEIERLRAALRGCVEHMEHSTQQGREAWRTAQALLSPEGDVK